PGGFEGLANLVVVAASGQNDNMAYFSNYGPAHVTVAAPGDNIISTVPGNEWESMSGTSMATPHVAGVATLVASAFPRA
ncbi:MAG: S8 family serine peptidase, partial [Thermoanaerobaculia bacterium]|nr:S8 family serine peptidase [Thermoanaerobaculia bacterium]